MAADKMLLACAASVVESFKTTPAKTDNQDTTLTKLDRPTKLAFSNAKCWVKRLTAALGFSLLALNASAQENRFQIDFMVFANKDPAAENSEVWPDRIFLRYPKSWAAPYTGDEGKSFERISAADPEFAQAAASIKRSSYYRVLYQASWQQDLENLKNAPAVLIKGGKEFGQHSELEGYIKLALERYLYIDTNLWLSKFEENSLSFDTESGTTYYLPPQPKAYQENTGLLDEEYESSPEYQAFLEQNPDMERRKWEMAMEKQQAQQASFGDYRISRIVRMEQRRRMRSDELHFIDHPLFGVLVKITKMKPQEIAPANPEQAKPVPNKADATPSTSANAAGQ
ncbi:peptidoglycan binding protein CsiV [Spongiibacter sp. KMU-158]|uniref:Peptidoglycan binding protein CsiV n=1 Tax=Spongiibacter pelagi TaxID=2760804 RepID=A0A927C0N4_9GAMM|nr:CsiV family protein [Spongiibacter pelagi]MBD2859094.1 peptidoglycan binding protein CsiV [Spongiibacter pelagi]